MKRPILLSALALSLLLNGVQFYSTLQSTPQADLSIKSPRSLFSCRFPLRPLHGKAPFHWREIESCDFASYIRIYAKSAVQSRRYAKSSTPSCAAH
ncbi:MAG: hypothetical protein IPK32_08855 [Verrucomicrobiaceae bacterium]|nr:hypothetical protein [Verrucomicrobiaceae bacterium]